MTITRSNGRLVNCSRASSQVDTLVTRGGLLMLSW